MKRVSYVEGRVRAVTVLGPFRALTSYTRYGRVTDALQNSRLYVDALHELQIYIKKIGDEIFNFLDINL